MDAIIPMSPVPPLPIPHVPSATPALQCVPSAIPANSPGPQCHPCPFPVSPVPPLHYNPAWHTGHPLAPAGCHESTSYSWTQPPTLPDKPAAASYTLKWKSETRWTIPRNSSFWMYFFAFSWECFSYSLKRKITACPIIALVFILF